MLQMGDSVGPRYTAPKISAISYLFGTFSLLIMGDTERPRYTGFRGLSVRGITALQCITFRCPNTKRTSWYRDDILEKMLIFHKPVDLQLKAKLKFWA